MSARIIRGFPGLVNRGRAGATVAIVLGMVAVFAVSASAQPPVPPPIAPIDPPDLKVRDVAAYIGHLGITRERDEDAFYYNDRTGVALGSLGAGFYWTEHVKTEVEIGRTSEARTTGVRIVNVPDVPPTFRAYTLDRTSATVITVAQSYQFFHNAWFHPFVTAGVDVGLERTERENPAQQYFPPSVFTPGQPPRSFPPIQIPAAPTEEFSRTTARGFGGLGFKAYLSHHAFFRSELRFGFGDEARASSFRIGFGADF